MPIPEHNFRRTSWIYLPFAINYDLSVLVNISRLTNPLCTLDKVTRSLDEDRRAEVFYHDSSDVFDSVNHLLLIKLLSFSIRGQVYHGAMALLTIS